MSLSRRLELLAAAAEMRAWIVEDDYDSEFRYVSRPLTALHGLDTDGRVIYVGTFSKVLFPALRIGFVIAPPSRVVLRRGTSTRFRFRRSRSGEAQAARGSCSATLTSVAPRYSQRAVA